MRGLVYPETVALRLPSLTREYLKVPVRAYEAGQAVDLTGTPVEMAVVALGIEPAAGDWSAADWEGVYPNLVARLLIGPGSTFGALTEGTYSVWVRVTRGLEVIVRHAGKLTVT